MAQAEAVHSEAVHSEMNPEPEPEAHPRSDDTLDDIIRQFYERMRGVFDTEQWSLMTNSFYNRFIKRDKRNLNFLIDKELLRRVVFGVSPGTIIFDIKVRDVKTEGKLYVRFCENELSGDHFVCVRLYILRPNCDFDKVTKRMLKAAKCLCCDECPELFDGSAPLVATNDKLRIVAFEMNILRSTFDREFTFDLFVVWIEYLAHNITAMHRV